MLRFSHISAREGLSQSTVRCIYQDYEGYLWIGTGDGLNRFNGYEFTHFLCDPTNPKSISDYDISCILETPQDSNLWIGTRRNGLNLFDRKFESFISFNKTDSSQQSLSGNNISALLTDQTQRLWVATTDGGLSYVNTKDTSIVQVKFENSPALNSVYSLIEDPNGNLWIGTRKGLYKWPRANILTTKEPELIKLSDNNSQAQISTLHFDFRGNLWIGTNSKGLFKLHPISGRSKHYFSANEKTETEAIAISDITQTQNGLIWVATADGLYAYIEDRDVFTSFKHDPDNNESINSDNLLCLFEDNAHILWVGTFVNGLNKMDPLRMRFQKFGQLVANKDRHADRNDIRSICMSDNKLWIGTSNGLLEASPEPEYYNPGASTKIHLKDRFISMTLYNKDYGLFVNAGSEIFHYTPRQQFKSLTAQVSAQTGIRDWTIYSGIVDNEKNNWYATYAGVLKHNPQNNTFSLKNPVDHNGQEIREIFVSIHEDYTGKIWLGTFKGNLYTYDKNTDAFTKITLKSKSGTEYIFTRVFSIYESTNGVMWFGTNKGLYKYNTFDNYAVRFLDSDGLPNNIVYSVLSQDKETIWCSTNKGITCYHLKGNYFTNFFYEDGLQSNEFNQNAYYKADNGTIYMGGVDGLNSFNPAYIKLNEFIPPVVISKIEVNYQAITPSSHPDLLKNRINATRQLTFNHDQNTISFEFNALSFSLPQKIAYRYSFVPKGQQDKWVEAGHRRFASFVNIPPGEYIFRIKSSNSDGVWNESYKQLSIAILPPIWKTWWFKTLLVIVISMAIYSIFYFRIKTIKRQRWKLEKLVLEKTNELVIKNKQIEEQNRKLTEINTELSATNEHINVKNNQLKKQHTEIVTQRNDLLKMAEKVEEANQAKMRFFTSLSHELRTPITLITNPIKDIISHLEDVSKQDLKKRLSIVDGNATKLLLIVNQLLDFRKVESGSMQMHISRFDLIAFIKQIAFLFNDMAQQKQYSFVFKSEFTRLIIWADIEKLEKVIYNLLSNAFKYTPEKGQIEIKVSSDINENNKKQVAISVKDNGEGIDEGSISSIFDPFFQLNNSKQIHANSSGLGLAITKQYIDLHKGTIHVESELSKGSTFTVFLPFGKKHLGANIHIVEADVTPKQALPSPDDSYTSAPYHIFETSEDKNKPLLVLIEDDRNLRLYIKDILSTHYRVEAAEAGKKGIALVTEKHPDIVISDVMLPDMNGFDICQQLKNEFQTSHIPIVLLTALADEESQFSGIEAGADAYISKPFDLKKLVLTIENLLLNRKRIQQKFIEGKSLDEIEISNSEDQQFLEMSQAIVEKNMAESDFDVSKLCKALGYSQPQVYRKIKALTDLSIAEFIRNIRLKKALQLLRTQKYKINQVAYEVGFSQPSYFTKCFTELFGQKPSDFIK